MSRTFGITLALCAALGGTPWASAQSYYNVRSQAGYAAASSGDAAVQPAVPANRAASYYADEPMPMPADPSAPAAAKPSAAPAPANCNCPQCQACQSCDSCGQTCGHRQGCGCPLDCPKGPDAWKLFDCCCLKENQLDMGGWVSVGFTANGDAPADRWNGPVGFNDRNEAQMNQLYWFVKKDIDYAKNCGFEFGGRIDLAYGTESRFTEAFGLEMDDLGNDKWNSGRFYHLALPQAYAELAWNDLGIKIGHFYTTIGNEVVTAPDNFFYSHAYTMMYGEPFTHTGVLFTKPLSEETKIHAGFHRGWDRWEDNNGELAFLGGISHTHKNECTKKETTIAFTITTGDEIAPTTGLDGNRTLYSLVMTRKISDRLQYIIQHDYGWQQNGAEVIIRDAPSTYTTAQWYGINQYLLYQLNCDWWSGVRLEWFRDDDGTRVAALGDSQTRANTNPAGSGGFEGNFYELTVGLNYKPVCNPNLVVRPEIRYDWYDGVGLPYDGATKDHQFLFGVDAIVKY